MMTVTGLLHGFQCPFMTFPTSAPHPPLFRETRPTFTSWFSSMSQARLYGLLSSSSLYFMVCLSLTRSFVHLKSPDFQDPQNTMKFAQGKKKNASQHLHGNFHVVARGSHTPKSVDAATWLTTLPCVFPSPLINFKSFLFIHIFPWPFSLQHIFCPPLYRLKRSPCFFPSCPAGFYFLSDSSNSLPFRLHFSWKVY